MVLQFHFSDDKMFPVLVCLLTLSFSLPSNAPAVTGDCKRGRFPLTSIRLLRTPSFFDVR